MELHFFCSSGRKGGEGGDVSALPKRLAPACAFASGRPPRAAARAAMGPQRAAASARSVSVADDPRREQPPIHTSYFARRAPLHQPANSKLKGQSFIKKAGLF